MKQKFKWILAPGVVFVVLSGCTDIRPLYGTNGGTYSESVNGQLADISIPEPTTRIDQLVRNDLLSAMSAPGASGNGRYTLKITLVERAAAAFIDTNSEISRKLYQLDAEYKLFDQTASGPISQKPIFTGKTFSEVSYDRITSEFANMQAKTDAQERAAGEVARDIRTRLAAYFVGRESSNVALNQ